MTVTASVSNGASRHAMPSIALSDFDYAALLYPDNERPENPESKDFVEGTKTEDGKLVFSFQKPDKTDGIKFTLEVFAFVKTNVEAEGGTKNFSRNSAPFSKAKPELTITGDTINVGDIALEVNKSSTEKGTVSLKIKVPDGCSLEIDETAKTNFDCKKDEASSNTYIISASGISAGAYQVTFTVKKDTEIVHIFSEYINVLNGLCTDTWNGLAKGEAKEITQSMISSTVYVRGTGGWYDTTSPYSNGETVIASDTNSGSFLSPFATIQKAVDKIIAINDGTSEYTIYIDGTLDGTTAALLGANGMADFSALGKNLTLTIQSLSGTATLDGGARFDADGNIEAGKEGIKKCIIYAKPASGALNLTLENLVIMGGYRLGNYSGGISFNSPGGELKISNGTTIRGNKATYAGGVCVYGGTFTMTGGTISDCTANSTGGGVYISPNGTFNMSGTAKITGCKTTSTGGNTGGGGIYNEGTLAITGGTISGCTSATSGGGIYNNASDASVPTTIANCEIIGCKANGTVSSNGGGGIYNASGTLELTDVNITGGNDIETPDARFGGGIYNAGTLIVTRGTISKCTSSSSGGGIYNSSGTLKITDSTISNCITGGNGGGIRTGGPASSDATTTAEIKNCTIESCTANSASSGEAGGGGIYCHRQALTLTGGTISDCTSENQGGGISIVSYNTPFTIDGVEITDCNAQNGGGCHIMASAAEGVTKEIKNCIIKSCEATTAGGGIGSTQYYNITVSGTEISECVSPSGSGIFTRSNSSLLLKDSTIKNDVCTNTGAASIYLAGSTTITEGVIDFSACTSTTSKPKLYVQDALTQNPVATIKIGTAYQAGDIILQAAENYTLTEADCKRFSIDDGAYDIALSDGKGVLVMGEVYLNSSSGDDANSGLTASNAVKTLSKAIELFESQYAQKIMICAAYTLPSGESDLLDRLGGGKQKLTLVRYDGSSDVSSEFTGNLLTVSQGNVTITNVTLDGNKENVTASGHLLYIDGSTTTVTLGDGSTVCNNKKGSRGSGVYISAGTFKMSGGTVTGNEGTSGYGPGVYIDNNGTFEMSGGKISGNDAYTSEYGGGGVYVRGTFKMDGGEISGNNAGNGGGVYVPTAGIGSFTMTGGKIINNIATLHGGGVYANGTFKMSGGEITGNTAPSGSGVYDTSSNFTQTGGTVQAN